MYIPSDFVYCQYNYHKLFPIIRPFVLDHECNFYVMHKDVDVFTGLDPARDIIDPPDMDYRYSAKVDIPMNYTGCRIIENSRMSQ